MPSPLDSLHFVNISRQPSAVSRQPSAVSRQPLAFGHATRTDVRYRPRLLAES
ncbi:MAG: hypothetical protein F6K37_35255 [Moorea sp. SIO4E2]|nr:hypothetical protein [Moorena sp. SIO4E2]